MHEERDTRETPHRTAIIKLYETRGITPGVQKFDCPYLGVCSESGNHKLHKGNWAFVGAEYGAAHVDGHKAKVLFVAMDMGGGDREEFERFPATQRSFRSSIESPRNPHMGGVALILKQLLDEGSALSTQCALTNAVKCA